MSFDWLRRAPIGVLLAAAACLAPSAALANANLAPPPDKFAMSPGGVDMRSGRFVYNQTDLVIGGDAGLSLTRSLPQMVLGHANPFGNLSHNWDILLSEKRVNIQAGDFRPTAGGPDYQIEISFGGVSQTFRSSLGGFYPISSGFGQLTWTGSSDRSQSNIVYTYLAADGTTLVFRAIGTLANAECSSQLRCAYVSQITRPDGAVLSFDYDTTGGAHAARLRTVTSSRGYALMFEYSSGLISKACVLNLGLQVVPSNHLCPSGAQAAASYAYTTSGGANLLAGATDPTGAVWGFTYGGGTMGFINPGETTPWLVNHFHDRTDDDGVVSQIVDSQNFADGSSYAYAFNSSPPVNGHVSQLAGGSYTNGLGEAVGLEYQFPIAPNSGADACIHNGCPWYNFEGTPEYTNSYQMTPGPVTVTDPMGRVTTFDHCDPTALANLPISEPNRCVVTPMAVSSTDPMGIQTFYTMDHATRNILARRQVAVPGSTQPNGQPWPDIGVSATYNCTATMFRSCAKPTSVTDARGNTTNFTYSADHGGALTETGPAPASGAPRPETRHIYAQRYAWISNGSGGYVQAATPIWVETATSTCRTSAATGSPSAPCATAGDEVLTQYDYGPDSGPNTLLLRGRAVTATDGGTATTLRTCYGYDSLGRRISEIQPNLNLSSCS